MSWPTTFANLTGGNQPLSLFDAMFQQVAAMVGIPSTASGTNAITLTPQTNCPTLAAYSQFCSFTFKAAATSTGLVTIGQTGLALLPLYAADGVTQITTGQLVNGQLYTIVFSQQLNSGGGGFYLLRSTLTGTTTVAGGSFSGLVISNNAVTPDTKIDVTATEIVMVNPSNGAPISAQAVAFTVDVTTVGANGIDGGSLAGNNWYYIFAISNGSTTAGLISLSATAPTLPGGYTFLKRLGALRSDFANAQTSTVTISNASPAVITWTANGLQNYTPVVFTTTGSLPTGLTVGTTYYVLNALTNSFNVSLTPNGAAINTSSAGSGTHTATVPNPRFMRTIQRGRDAQYVIQSAPTPPFFPPLIANGIAGTFNTASPVLATVSVATIVPPTAATIKVMAWNVWTNLAGGSILVAPNATWGGTQQGPAGTALFVWPIYLNGATVASGFAELTLEASTIAWCASTAGCAIACLGWRDFA